jgi:hypothetical protein
MGPFAKAKELFLRGFLKLENGVPSRSAGFSACSTRSSSGRRCSITSST